MRFHARVSPSVLSALLVGAILALAVPVAAQAEAPEIETLVAVNCKVANCAQTEETFNLGPLGEYTYVEPKEPNVKEAEEEGYLQAGGRVPFGVTDFKVETNGKVPIAEPTSTVEHLRTDVAPGLATAPTAVAECSAENFGDEELVPGSGFYPPPKCATSGPEDTVVGTQHATVWVKEAGVDIALEGTVYNLDPAEGLASEYGVALELPEALAGSPGIFVHTLIEGNVEWGKQARGTNQGDYHDYFEINVSTALPLVSSRLDFEGTNGEGDFVTNATSCPGHNTTTLKLTDVKKVTVKKEYTTPVGLFGCNKATEEDKLGTKFTKELPFEPAFELESEQTAADQPNQITTVFSEPHHPKAVDGSQVRTASITLPEGMTLNPSAAYGLEACTPAEARINSEEFGVTCPEGSAVGTDTLDVPGLPDGSLTGSVYLGGPESGPITGPPFTIYVVANSKRYGISVRLKGEVEANRETGQLTTSFKEPPEQPFRSLTVHFGRGMLTSIANPLICGTPTGTASFTPVSGTPASKESQFGVSVTGCAAPLPFALTQSTEGDNVTAGAHTSYNFNLVRADGQQYLKKVKATLPSGLVGEIPAITLCGEPQASKGECAAASRIGTATVTAGAGSFPYTFSGPVYMTGPYNGAPFGLSIAVPAVAGPFNFGTIVTRSTININQTTSRVTAETTLPTIVEGVPMRLRSISVNVNRQGFLLNPTNCSAEATETTLTSTSGTLQEGLTTPFQVEGCSGLSFKPTFTASTSGKPSKVNGASLVTTITQPAGQANIKSVFVQLPLQLPSRLTSLQKACLAATFEANPFSCPSASQVGTATAITPVLPGQMTGPVYLVSFGGEEFPQVDLVLEDEGVRVIVVGHTKITKGITTTNFAAAPDVPVSSITVNLPLASNSALAANGNLCAPTLLMPTTITGQNGSVFKQNTVISPTGCGVQIIGHKVVGNTAYLTVKTFAAGRISGSGKSLSTVYRTLSSASKAATLKVALSKKGRGRRRPFKVTLRVGFVPKKGAHTSATVTVKFRR